MTDLAHIYTNGIKSIKDSFNFIIKPDMKHAEQLHHKAANLNN